jgi:tRNA 2-thiouridine synthesizing protein E
MSTLEVSGITAERDDEGYMTDHTAWNADIAAMLAAEEGIDQLTDAHFKVLEFMRKEFEEKGSAPSIRRLNKMGVVPVKELYTLFPGGPAKKSAKIAGLKKPVGCI